MNIMELIGEVQDEAPQITLYGIPGVGKTTLASQFPKPLFLLTEKPRLKVRATPVASNFATFWKYLVALSNLEELDFETLVLDSISKLDKLIEDHLMSSAPDGTTLATFGGGYGAGYLAVAQTHRAIKSRLDRLQERGITIVYIAHSCEKPYKSPESEDYDVYTITACSDKVREVYINDVDAVLFCRIKATIDETASKRAIVRSSGKRIVVTDCNPINVSKNRFSMPPELPMNFKDISKYISYYHKE